MLRRSRRGRRGRRRRGRFVRRARGRRRRGGRWWRRWRGRISSSEAPATIHLSYVNAARDKVVEQAIRKVDGMHGASLTLLQFREKIYERETLPATYPVLHSSMSRFTIVIDSHLFATMTSAAKCLPIHWHSFSTPVMHRAHLNVQSNDLMSYSSQHSRSTPIAIQAQYSQSHWQY